MTVMQSNAIYYQGKTIRTWKQFAKRVRRNGCELLANLGNFEDSVLVAGCQRSGTTMLARIITSSAGMTDYRFGKDDELDAALILSNKVIYKDHGRHCFQTTYLNECYREYYGHINKYKLIWVIRNPGSVVYSLLHNWKRFALNELFIACGKDYLTGSHAEYYKYGGYHLISPLRRACLAYVGKQSQIFELKANMTDDDLLIIDYDDLVQNKEIMLPKIYDFINLAYSPEYASFINSTSLHKSAKLSKKEKRYVDKLCMPVYEKARNYI